MIKLLLLAFCLLTIQGQVTLCQNSPKNIAELQAILKAALTKLQLNLLSPMTANLDNTCSPSTGNVAKCGYPSKVIQNAGASALVNNLDLAYQSMLTNSSKILHPTDPGSINDFTFQLRSDEAIVYLTCTPPSQYFSYSIMLYSDGLPSASNPKAIRQGILGDSLNHLRINTWSVEAGNPRNAASLVVIAAKQSTVNTVISAFTQSGFPSTATNVIALPTSFLKLGTDLSTSSYMTVIGRQSILTGAERELVYTLGDVSTLSFPFVRLTPTLPINLNALGADIAPIPTWVPDYSSADLLNVLKQSEQMYEPAIFNAVATIVQTVKTALPTTIDGRSVSWTVSPQRPFRFEDFGEKWVMEKEFGLASGRDASYYAYSPTLTPLYDDTVGFGATVLVGVRHESTQWTIPNPAVPAFTPSAKPHALFWNAVWNNVGSLAAAAGFNYLHPGNKAWTSLPMSLGGGDPLGVIWVNAFGSVNVTNTAGTAPGAACAALTGIGIDCVDAPAAARNVTGLTVLYRTYVDPATGVYPSPLKIAAAQLISIQGRFTT